MLDTPAIYQANCWHCGPAALGIVLSFYGMWEPEYRLAAELGADPFHGTCVESIIAAGERRGFCVDAFSASGVSDLEKFVESWQPVIVCMQQDYPLEDGSWDSGHYAVVRGVDDNYVYLQDPSPCYGRRTMTRDDFDLAWFDFGCGWRVYDRYMVVFKPRGNDEGRDDLFGVSVLPPGSRYSPIQG